MRRYDLGIVLDSIFLKRYRIDRCTIVVQQYAVPGGSERYGVTGEGKLSYQQAFSVIGAYLDRQQYQEVVLCELDDGYVIRAGGASGTMEAVALPYADLRQLAARVASTGDMGGATERAPRDMPSVLIRSAGSYRNFLTALGRQCDLFGAASASVIELADHVLVTFMRRVAGGEPIWREYLYDIPGINQLLFSSGVPIAPQRK